MDQPSRCALDQSPAPTDNLQSPRYQQRQNRLFSLQQTLSSYGSDIMARVTRSSKHKATPTSTPTKDLKTVADADADADTPIESVEAATLKKDSKHAGQRKPRKKRQRDAAYKIKKRGLKKAGLAVLNLPQAEQKTLRAGIEGNKTSQKLADVVLEQRAEIDRLREQLNGDSKSSDDSAQAGSRKRQRKTIA